MYFNGAQNANGKTILLVDGDDCLRILVREYLEANGFAVKDAPTTAEALRVAGGWGGGRPDLLVSAVHLPDASGAWLAGLLRRRDRPGLAVVYLVYDDMNLDAFDRTGRHLQKPFSFLQLHAAVEDALVTAESDRPIPRPVYGFT